MTAVWRTCGLFQMISDVLNVICCLRCYFWVTEAFVIVNHTSSISELPNQVCHSMFLLNFCLRMFAIKLSLDQCRWLDCNFIILVISDIESGRRGRSPSCRQPILVWSSVCVFNLIIGKTIVFSEFMRVIFIPLFVTHLVHVSESNVHVHVHYYSSIFTEF